jgi:hypothetical protein
MGAALFIAGDASALVTSTSLLVDGGWTADWTAVEANPKRRDKQKLIQVIKNISQ